MKYKYYFKLRPPSLGTFPDKRDNKGNRITWL